MTGTLAAITLLFLNLFERNEVLAARKYQSLRGTLTAETYKEEDWEL
jgi:hypothetical protein